MEKLYVVVVQVQGFDKPHAYLVESQDQSSAEYIALKNSAETVGGKERKIVISRPIQEDSRVITVQPHVRKYIRTITWS